METITIHLTIDNVEIDPKAGKLIININGEALKRLTGKTDSTSEKDGKKYRKSRFRVFMEWLIDKMLA